MPDLENRLRDAILDDLISVAAAEEAYIELIQAISEGFPLERRHTSENVRRYCEIRTQQAVDEGLVLYQGRIVVPQAA